MSNLIFKCNKCKTLYSINCNDLEWQEVERNERKMGPEIHRIAEIVDICEKCKNNMQVTLHIWEYPIGAIEITDTEENGVEIIEQNCEYEIKDF